MTQRHNTDTTTLRHYGTLRHCDTATLRHCDTATLWDTTTLRHYDTTTVARERARARALNDSETSDCFVGRAEARAAFSPRPHPAQAFTHLLTHSFSLYISDRGSFLGIWKVVRLFVRSFAPPFIVRSFVNAVVVGALLPCCRRSADLLRDDPRRCKASLGGST